MKKLAILLGLVVLDAGYAQEQACEEGFRLFENEFIVESVCVPENPQRVVALESIPLEILSLTDVPVVGTMGYIVEEFENNFSSLEPVQAVLSEITDVGYFPPNLESVAALQPDLIIAGSYLESLDQLRTIAPTVVLDFESTVAWKDAVRLTGELFGLTDLTDALFAEYQTRIDTLTELVSDPSDIEVSIVRLQEDSVNLMLDVFSSTVIEDAGFSRPESQAYSAEEAQEVYGNALAVTISLEELQLADADYVFIWGAFYSGEVDTFAEEVLGNPLWQSLDAVQNDQAHRVGEHWIGRGFYGAHAVLDDLFTYIADVDPQEVSRNPFLSEETSN